MVSAKRWKISDKLELVGHLGDISHGHCEKEMAGEKKSSCSLVQGAGLNEEMINLGTPGCPISMLTAGRWAEWPPGWNLTHSVNSPPGGGLANWEDLCRCEVFLT